jgi:hypothetical protein
VFSGIPSDLDGQMPDVAKKLSLSYPVTPEWCERVHQELERRGRGSQSRLAEFLSVSTGHLADHLSGKYQTSDLVEGIHEFFEWVPPVPPTASLDAGELYHGCVRLDPQQRTFIMDAIAALKGDLGPHQQRTLEEMLKLFHGLKPDND